MSTATERRFIIVTDTFEADRPGTGRKGAQAYTVKQTRRGRRIRRAKMDSKCWYKAWAPMGDESDKPSVFTREEAEHFLPLFSTAGIVCQIVEVAQ